MKLGLLIAAGALALISTAAIAGDPFDDARYYMGIKKNADALRLIDSGQFDVNMQNEEGYTLLHYAADNGNNEMVKALLQRGADPTIKANSGSTAYDMATGTSIKVLLANAQAGGKVEASASAAAPEAPAPASAAGKLSASNGMCAAVRAEQVNNGRSPALRPFLRARDDIWYNHPDELEALLDDCVDANAKDPSGSTLLHAAADRDRVGAAKILLAHGASKSATDAAGNIPAAYATSPEMKALLGSEASKARGAAASIPSAERRKQCSQKFYVDQGTASDETGKARAYRKWTQCLKTGLYYQ
ncbi:uncharacterized protein ACUXST_001695 [Sphingomonas sp. F9_3S_D5_B_2]